MLRLLLLFSLVALITGTVSGQCPLTGLVCPPTKICFAIDESGSINDDEFDLQTGALIDIVDSFLSCSPGSSFAAAGFSSDAHRISRLTTNIDNFKNKLRRNDQVKGYTSSGSGLIKCSDELENESDPRVIVLITDGQDNRTPFGTVAAPDIRRSGITIAVIGVTDDVNEADLREIASKDPATNDPLYTFVDDFDRLVLSLIHI